MRNYSLYIPVILLFLASSCSPVLYSTIGQNVPLFRNKNEVSLNVSAASSDDGDGIGVQFAAAADSQWAVITSFYALSNKASDQWQGSGTYFELGGGRFGTLDSKKTFIYEAFLGLGFGGIENSDQNSTSTVDLKFIKTFIQPSVGISGEWYDVALTPRFALVSYTDHTESTDDPTFQSEADAYFDNKKNTFVFEPGITIRLGYKSVKAQILYNISTFSYGSNSDVNINNTFGSFGVNWLISKRYKTK